MINVFVKNKVIDNNRIRSALNAKKAINYDTLKKEWDEITVLLHEEGVEDKNPVFNYNEQYVTYFVCLFHGLSLDELEFINDNNLFEFDKKNLLDYNCQKLVNERIANYKQALINLNKCIQNNNLGSYFQGSMREMLGQGTYLYRILGLDRENIELTELGVKLKLCIENIINLYRQVDAPLSTSKRK